MPVLVALSVLPLVHSSTKFLSRLEDQTSLIGLLEVSCSTVLLFLQSLRRIAERRYTVQ